LSDWLLAASILLSLFLVWRVIVVVQRYHRTDYGNRWLNWLEGLNRLFCLKFHRLEHDPSSCPPAGRHWWSQIIFPDLMPCC
jgi:1-acyl-sn-glycerol-3-phosphate acyltransferase